MTKSCYKSFEFIQSMPLCEAVLRAAGMPLCEAVLRAAGMPLCEAVLRAAGMPLCVSHVFLSVEYLKEVLDFLQTVLC